MYKKIGKRIIGFVLSFFGLVICIVPMIIIGIIIKLDSKGEILFKQERLGKDRKTFVIYKFRTMVKDAYEIGGIASRSDDPRITKIGSFLRRTSLDELPQMINILRGDMAIIGPRPILDDSICIKRYSILPGLFCTVDIDLRAAADRKTQFYMDAEYAENLSLKNDLTIFFKVIKTVITGKNVYRIEVNSRREK